MNEQQTQAPLELPKPINEVVSDGQETDLLHNPAEISAAQALETGSSKTSSLTPDPVKVQTGQASQPLPLVQLDDAGGQITQQDVAIIADDVDLIEKEWIERAKRVVEQTRTDPHSQNIELGKVKADYVKKRYDRDIKLNQD